MLSHQVRACMCFCVSAHSLILVSAAVAACTCVWFRLQLAHRISGLCFTSLSLPHYPPTLPLFPPHTFPQFFFSPALLVPALLPARIWTGGGSTVVKWGPTMRCKLDRCVSGMKRTGWITWSSRVWKKVHSLPIELLTKDLAANKGG